MTHLHIFALNEPVAVSHTNLTRQQGLTPDLPPLAAWLGVDSLDTDEIELFPIKDLSDMALSDYINLAFAPEDPIPSAIVTRLDALDGAVLLVPEDGLATPPNPGPQATLIASLPLARADNTASLPKASTTPMPNPAAPRHEVGPPIALYALIGMAILAAIIVFVGWR
ncbi:hypothetical protein KUL25_13455 [Rhodobacteraceae bacterium N5(2021)]|uniref:Uncharacterized protein n=1 Tax=Gymnodinialimonas phycosphaerae TaxID=2841589 RepID=A0A975TSE7_9RHOB|nr:hypothetical protein [Gymnodinialimonas phycosphaerae]MBY4893771.1 hypothetical protein [Gymnodinialimonas phycosphaerae]